MVFRRSSLSAFNSAARYNRALNSTVPSPKKRLVVSVPIRNLSFVNAEPQEFLIRAPCTMRQCDVIVMCLQRLSAARISWIRMSDSGLQNVQLRAPL
jgi:hypothetical protein